MKFLFKTLALLVCLSNLYAKELINKQEFINPTTKGKIWLYLPNIDSQKVPLVIVPPAGTRLFHGINLSEGDSKEHIPYVKAGFAVLSFDLSGSWPESNDEMNAIRSISQFVNRRSGIKDVKEALDIIKTNTTRVDFNSIVVAGHSSAATLSIMIAQQLPNIKACIAFAPVINLEEYLKEEEETLSLFVPKFKENLIDLSPSLHTNSLTMPVFLFSAKDDDSVNNQISSYSKFISEVKSINRKTKYVEVKSGGHYYSMINDGIPQAITWLKGIIYKE